MPTPTAKPTKRIDAAARRGGMRALAAPLASAARATLGRRGFAEGGLVTDWPAIVGTELALRSAPLKLAFPMGGRRDGTLHVRVSGGLALELQHLEPVVLERINGYFGYRAVGRLRITQGPLPPVRPQTDPALPPPSAEDEASIARQVGAVEHEPLREALAQFARAVRGATRR